MITATITAKGFWATEKEMEIIREQNRKEKAAAVTTAK